MIKPFKTLTVSGTPLDYIAPTSQDIKLGQALKQGTTMGGRVGIMTGTTSFVPEYISFSPSSQVVTDVPIPVFRVTANQEFIVSNATSNSAISTTNAGKYYALTADMQKLNTSTTGTFKVSTVYNTSSAAEQFFTGYFVKDPVTV